MKKAVKNKKVIAIIAVALLAVLMAATGVIASPPPSAGDSPVTDSINYQGQLTDSAGNPLNGSYDMEFQFWNDPTGGSQVGSTITKNSVEVTNGLFSVKLDVDQSDFNGQGLWIEVTVEGETLSPRQEILPVPYALSLKPGAEVKGTAGKEGDVLYVKNEGSAAGSTAIHGYSSTTSGKTFGVLGSSHSSEGVGVRGTATASDGETYGVYGTSSSIDGVGVRGFASADPGELDPPGVAYGVVGESKSRWGIGVYGLASHTDGYTHGVYGRCNSPDGYAGKFYNNGSGGIGVIADGGGEGAPDLVLGTSVGQDGRIYSGLNNYSSDIWLVSNDDVWIELDENNDPYGEDSCFYIRDGADQLLFMVSDEGDVVYQGGLIGAFPGPAYDSGWVSIAKGTSETLIHGLGGNTDNYVIDLQFKDTGDGLGVHQNSYGGRYDPTKGTGGAYWRNLTNTTIEVTRYVADNYVNEIRVRIWVYE